eukprot:4077458-Amphidinium_carterae.3
MIKEVSPHLEVLVLTVFLAVCPPWHHVWTDRLKLSCLQTVAVPSNAGIRRVTYGASCFFNLASFEVLECFSTLEEWELGWGFLPRHSLLCDRTRARKEQSGQLAALRESLLNASSSANVLAEILVGWARRESLLPALTPELQFSQVSPLSLVERLIRATDCRGSDVRLDSGQLVRPFQWPRRPISVQQWEWSLCTKWRWHTQASITELELRALLTGVKWRLRRGDSFLRFLHLVDSQSAAAVAVKGRSSSCVFMYIVRQLDALLLAHGVNLFIGYTDIDANPVDRDSRDLASSCTY